MNNCGCHPPVRSRPVSAPRAGGRLALLMLLLAPVVAAQPAAPGPQPEAPASGEIAPAITPAAADARQFAQQQFLRLVDQERYDEAAEIAARIVELTVQTYGESSVELASPLDNLATVQMHRGDLTAAESNYQRSIAIIEKAEGILSPALINPLIGLGATYTRAGLYALAEESYKRALRVNHARDGFYNFEQFRIRDGLTEAYLGLDKFEDANFQQQTQLAIQERRYGEQSPELVPAIHKLARWYNRSGQYPAARLAYQSAGRLLKEARGGNDPAIVDSLLGEARTYQNEGLMGPGAHALKDALKIINAQPEPDRLRRAEVLINLGDLYTAFNKPKSARERYTQAWQDLSLDAAFEEQRDRYFAQPRRIAGQPLDRVTTGAAGKGLDPRRRPEAFAEGYVAVSLAVDVDGRVRDPKVVEATPPGLMDSYVLGVLEKSRFRPRYADGVPVITEAVVYRHDFKYVRSLVTAEEGPAGTDATTRGKGEPIAYPGADSDDPDGTSNLE